MQKKTIKDISLHNKAILIRVDYNVPLSSQNNTTHIIDDTRIRQSLPTIEYVLSQKPKRVVLISHLGDPQQSHDPKYSLAPVATHLEKLLGKSVKLVSHYVSIKDQEEIVTSQSGELFMLENVRYHREEELNNRRFAAELARMGDVFINDAFGSSHRAHASVVGVAEFLPAVAGLLLSRELEMIGSALEAPKRPFVVILGGAKATTKIPMIDRLMTKADYLLLGGGLANTFLKALGYAIGRSVYSPESIRISQTLIWKATRVDTKLFLPSDVVVGNFATKTKEGVVGIDAIPTQLQALDIGPQTIGEYAAIIKTAKTIIWNGPVGANEVNKFCQGTNAIYNAIIANTQATSIVGGGDTLASIAGQDHLQNITHVSTGGGAMLEFIEKGTLPGVDVLLDK